MTCILRVSGPGIETVVSRVALKPLRTSADGAHFDVSNAGFDNFMAQVDDAIAFLRVHATDLKLLFGVPGISGVLDFAIEWRGVAAQFGTFPAALVREAGSLGFALEVSHYPRSVASEGEA